MSHPLGSFRSLAIALVAIFALAACGDSPGGEDASDASVEVSDIAEDSGFDASDSDDADAGANDAAEADTPSDVADVDAAEQDVGADVGRDTFFDPDVPSTGDTATDVPVDAMGVYSIDPSSGPTDGGTFVLIFGYGFTVDTVVLVNGRAVEGLDFVDDETLLAYMPANPVGVYDVKFVNGGTQAILEEGFAYYSELTLSGVEPAVGPERGGVPVRVTGAGFTADTFVSVGGRLGIDRRFIDASTLEFILPPGVAGTADVRVTNANGSVALDDAFTFYAEPEIESISPGAGARTGGYETTIFGRGLGSVTEVSFGPANAVINAQSETSIVVVVPAGNPGGADVRVAGPNGGDTAMNGFVYIGDGGTLEIDGVVPNSGPEMGGDTVLVVGPLVDQAVAVRFDDAPATSLVALGPGMLAVVAPAGVGSADVHVDLPTATANLPDAYRYLPVLEVEAVTPSTGDVAGGEPVTITGAGFTSSSTVRFGPASARSTFISSTELAAIAPPGPLGFVDVQVNDNGRVATLAEGFRYTEVPAISALVPSRGSIAGNTYIIIRGRGFNGDIEVLFGADPATDVTVIDGATLAVRSPRHAAGRAGVRVVVDGVETNVSTFVYFDPYSPAGGWWGDAINGSVNVTVENGATGERVPDAYATLHLRADESARVCRTNDAGQCTISYPDVLGRQTISASAVGFSSATVTSVDAENVIISLSETVPPSSGPPPEYTPPTIVGTLDGLDKLIDPSDDERIVGVIRTSTPGVGASNPQGTGFAQVTWNGESTALPYAMASREGELAVIALCGVLSNSTGEFTPLYMGIQRGLVVRGEGTELEVNLDCNIHLSQSLTFKFRSPPLYAGGPEINEAIPYLNLGNEGATDLLRTARGRDEILTQDHFAPLSVPELADVFYDVIGQSEPLDGGLPFSVVYARNVVNLDERVDFPESVAPADILYPAPNAVAVERRFEWQLPTDIDPDFYYAYIEEPGLIPIRHWEVWLPGDQTGFNLPYFPPDADTAVLPTGSLVIVVLAIDAYTFDYTRFEDNDFGSWNWASYSGAGHYFINPD